MVRGNHWFVHSEARLQGIIWHGSTNRVFGSGTECTKAGNHVGLYTKVGVRELTKTSSRIRPVCIGVHGLSAAACEWCVDACLSVFD